MGKWAPVEFDRVIAEKVKELFYATRHPVKTTFDPDVEREFRTFVKTLDVNSTSIKACFETLVQAQTQAGVVEARRRRIRESNFPLAARYYDTSHARVEGMRRTRTDLHDGPSTLIAPTTASAENEDGWETVLYPPRGWPNGEPIHDFGRPSDYGPYGPHAGEVEAADASTTRLRHRNARPGGPHSYPGPQETSPLYSFYAGGAPEFPLFPGSAIDNGGDDGYAIFAPYNDLGPMPADTENEAEQEANADDDAGARQEDETTGTGARTLDEDPEAPQHEINTETDELFRLMTTYGDYDPRDNESAAGLDLDHDIPRAVMNTASQSTSEQATGRDPSRVAARVALENRPFQTAIRIPPRAEANRLPSIYEPEFHGNSFTTRRRRRHDELDIDTGGLTAYDSDQAYRNARRRTMYAPYPAAGPTARPRRVRHSLPPPGGRRDTRRDGIVFDGVYRAETEDALPEYDIE